MGLLPLLGTVAVPSFANGSDPPVVDPPPDSPPDVPRALLESAALRPLPPVVDRAVLLERLLLLPRCRWWTGRQCCWRHRAGARCDKDEKAYRRSIAMRRSHTKATKAVILTQRGIEVRFLKVFYYHNDTSQYYTVNM